MEFKPFNEETINDIMKTHPELSREYIISKHREIYDSITDEMVNDFLENIKNYEDTFDEYYIEWDFDQAKKLLISIEEGKFNLTMDWEIIRNRLYDKLKGNKDDNIN